MLSPSTARTPKAVARHRPYENWGRLTRRIASLKGVDSSERADTIEGSIYQRVPPAKGLCAARGGLSKTAKGELSKSLKQETVLVECVGYMQVMQ
jgi:hypothetical protein